MNSNRLDSIKRSPLKKQYNTPINSTKILYLRRKNRACNKVVIVKYECLLGLGFRFLLSGKVNYFVKKGRSRITINRSVHSMKGAFEEKMGARFALLCPPMYPSNWNSSAVYFTSFFFSLLLTHLNFVNGENNIVRISILGNIQDSIITFLNDYLFKNKNVSRHLSKLLYSDKLSLT